MFLLVLPERREAIREHLGLTTGTKSRWNAVTRTDRRILREYGVTNGLGHELKMQPAGLSSTSVKRVRDEAVEDENERLDLK